MAARTVDVSLSRNYVQHTTFATLKNAHVIARVKQLAVCVAAVRTTRLDTTVATLQSSILDAHVDLKTGTSWRVKLHTFEGESDRTVGV